MTEDNATQPDDESNDDASPVVTKPTWNADVEHWCAFGDAAGIECPDDLDVTRRDAVRKFIVGTDQYKAAGDPYADDAKPVVPEPVADDDQNDDDTDEPADDSVEAVLAAKIDENVNDVVRYAEENPDHAARLLELEQAKEKPRPSLVEALGKLTED